MLTLTTWTLYLHWEHVGSRGMREITTDNLPVLRATWLWWIPLHWKQVKKGIRPCMALYECILVDTVANMDVNSVEWYKGKLR
jgi:hypothetical protein